MWDDWNAIDAAQAIVDRARERPKAAQDAPEPPRAAVGWEAEKWGAPKPSPGEASLLAQRAVWEEEHRQTVDGLIALLRSFLPPEDTNG
jgi:hypothetical protein